jgi:hypothetical protein
LNFILLANFPRRKTVEFVVPLGNTGPLEIGGSGPVVVGVGPSVETGGDVGSDPPVVVGGAVVPVGSAVEGD